MPKVLSQTDFCFPSGHDADEHGIVAIGGDFSWLRLLAAYRSGIFPWPHEGWPILWFCPDPRFVLLPQQILINQSLVKAIKRTTLEIRADTNFFLVMKKCQDMSRKGQKGTWITDDMVDGYNELHRQGFAHSIEAFDNEQLVGGLYGVSLGSIFFGESMFFEQPNASKICFVTLVAHLLQWNFSLIDCQAHTSYLEKFGAKPMARDLFLDKVAQDQTAITHLAPWHLHLSPQKALVAIRERLLKNQNI